MEEERWLKLMESDSLKLTDDEIRDGWHFCGDWDGLLVGPTMPMEQDCCTCFRGIAPPAPSPPDGEAQT